MDSFEHLSQHSIETLDRVLEPLRRKQELPFEEVMSCKSLVLTLNEEDSKRAAKLLAMASAENLNPQLLDLALSALERKDLAALCGDPELLVAVRNAMFEQAKDRIGGVGQGFLDLMTNAVRSYGYAFEQVAISEFLSILPAIRSGKNMVEVVEKLERSTFALKQMVLGETLNDPVIGTSIILSLQNVDDFNVHAVSDLLELVLDNFSYDAHQCQERFEYLSKTYSDLSEVCSDLSFTALYRADILNGLLRSRADNVLTALRRDPSEVLMFLNKLKDRDFHRVFNIELLQLILAGNWAAANVGWGHTKDPLVQQLLNDIAKRLVANPFMKHLILAVPTISPRLATEVACSGSYLMGRQALREAGVNSAFPAAVASEEGNCINLILAISRARMDGVLQEEAEEAIESLCNALLPRAQEIYQAALNSGYFASWPKPETLTARQLVQRVAVQVSCEICARDKLEKTLKSDHVNYMKHLPLMEAIPVGQILGGGTASMFKNKMVREGVALTAPEELRLELGLRNAYLAAGALECGVLDESYRHEQADLFWTNDMMSVMEI
ncbi:hypothetical protein HNP46_000495 [Pseudomonas nitritireducens]|uniref:Uncharacterized protein n=1 Tax=Pseudomonas nitroreducens TaxID=46680 RepID=A0A7W7KG51_PSENT|nr:hypothetical protein [Pseudomonas nitritireducens]MBB4861684.1 hypothetical protein [Pseudomonas nitritireducens]